MSQRPLSVAVIGAGMAGRSHAAGYRQVNTVFGEGLPPVRLAAIADANQTLATDAARRYGFEKAVFSWEEIVEDPAIDAVSIVVGNALHRRIAEALFAAGKHILCEKPLATTREACERILDAEVAAGRRMVMVGFMRRYDEAYRAMKDALTAGLIGAPLMYYSGHRNPSVPPSVTTEGVLVDTCVHDIDVSRWLLDSEVVSAQVFSPRRTSHAAEVLQDPLLLMLTMSDGVLVNVEAAVNIAYGYDIRGEVLGETGTIELAESGKVVVKREGQFSGRVPGDWRERFLRAYDVELQEWLEAVAAGRSTGPSSWDGYAATLVCDAATEAYRTGAPATVTMREKPDLYRDGAGADGYAATGTD